MRNTLVATSVAVCLLSGSLGCKSAPKMAFWKSGEKSDVESTALAHSAPALPADVAKQAETLANASPSIDLSASVPPAASGAQAPPFSPAPPYTPSTASVSSTPAPSVNATASAAMGAYPTTGAPSFASTPTASTSQTTPTSSAPAAAASPAFAASTPPALYNSDQSANLGSVDMPYNPNAVPPAKTVAAAPTTPSVPTPSTDRYGSSSLANRYANTGAPSIPPVSANVSTASVPAMTGGDRYANVTTNPPLGSSNVNLASTSAAPVATTPAVPPMVDRYASTGAPEVTPTASPASVGLSGTATASVPPASSAPSFNSTPQVASAQPYRPGGTSTYEGLSAEQAGVEIASRPTPPETSVPYPATPASTGASPAPQYR